MLITKIKIANLITYMGITFAMYAIFFAIDGQINEAFICFMLSGVCDMFDGMFARKFKRTDMEKEIGIQMDSLADVISFLVVPVVIYMGLGMNKSYHFVIYAIYILMGITRLGFFNVYAAQNKEKVLKVYRGLAVTYASLIFPIIHVVMKLILKSENILIYIVVMVIMSVLFLLDIPIPKPSKKGYIVLSLLAIIMIIIYVSML